MAPDRRYVARSADGARTVLMSLPAPGADPGRWAAEARWANQLTQPGFWPVAQVGGTAAFPWHATPYRPVLPLTAAIAAHGGPLPEESVRVIGAALAEALASAHVLGVSHGGVSPATVLLTAYGPLLACLGATRIAALHDPAARAAAPEGTPHAELPGLDRGCVAPEQFAGQAVDPPGDVYALGAVLAYVATGHTVPEQVEIPAGLRTVITACLARVPGERPEPVRVMQELAPGAAYGTHVERSEPMSLPGRVVAALSEQAARVLAMEMPAKVR
ncbi:serine/threonine protein kinase [Streptomyces zagrosensis]|uniref:Serine/threonine protein kinase n=1 Tax=Streptomyces zagrosensis TaxID=1042984 RepID=A0A7W9QA21_9ACTN|nr:serine/threonine protein kinase [Streptomyces zagrosensis]MBB5936144.1 serine/threonine protein kinase [Streptomyces zagrosensis]